MTTSILPETHKPSYMKASKIFTLLAIFILSTPSLFAQSYLIPVDVPTNQYPVTFTDAAQKVLMVEFDRAVTAPGTSAGWTITVGGVPVVMVGAPLMAGNFIRITLPASIGYNDRSSVLVTYNAAVGTMSLTGPVEPNFVNQAAYNNWIPVKADFSSDVYGEKAPFDICAAITDVEIEYNILITQRLRNSIHYNSPRVYLTWISGIDATKSQKNFVENAPVGSGTYKVIVQMTDGPGGMPAGYPSNTSNCTWKMTMFPYMRIGTSAISVYANDNPIVINLPNYKLDNGTPVPGTGDLGLFPQVDHPSTLFCVGEDITAFIFTDATVFDCQIAVEVDRPNTNPRYVQYVYGTQTGNGIPNVFIDVYGTPVQVTDAAGNSISGVWHVNPDGSPNIPGYTTPSGFFEGPVVQYLWDNITKLLVTPMAQTYPISHTGDYLNDMADDIFDVTLRNWGPCNPYDAMDPFTYTQAVTDFSRLRLVAAPPLPTAPDVTVCIGASTLLSAVRNGTNPGMLHWYNNADLLPIHEVGTGNTYNPGALAANVYNYWVREIGTTGQFCEGPAEEVILTVNPFPNKPTITAGDTDFCFDGGITTVTLTANVVTPPVVSSYQWYKGGVAIGGATSSTITLGASATDGGTYTVRAFGAAPTNCPGPLSDPELVLIHSLDNITNPVATAVCENGIATFTVSTTEAGVSYKWEEFNGTSWGPVGGGAPYSNWLTGTLTINPVPLGFNGYRFRCEVKTNPSDGNCPFTSGEAVLTVNPNAAITLISAAGTNIQTRCINTAITNIRYSVTGSGTGAGVVGLPAGVTGSFAAGVFTISGTPTVVGNFPFTVTTTGTCVQATATGTITVQALPTANAGGVMTAICQGGTSGVLGGSVGGSATGGMWSTPAGGTFNPNATTLNATWTPPAAYSGTATLTLTTTGGVCTAATASKNITVHPSPNVNVGGALAAICQGGTSAALGGSVGGSATGGTWSSSAGGTFNPAATNLNATWTPPAAYVGTATLTLTTSGGTCGTVFSSKTQVVNPNAVITRTSAVGTIAQTRCINTAITNITYSVTGGGTGAGVVGLPAGVIGSFAGGVFTISGTPTAAGNFPYTVNTTGTCTQAVANGTITVQALPTAGAGPVMPAICQGGTSGALGGTVGGSATGGTWSTTAGGTFNPNATTLNATWTPPAAYTGTATLVLTTSGGLCIPVTANKNILVRPNPTPVITGLNNVCAGTAGVVYSTPLAGANTYAWNISGGVITAGAGTRQITVTWGAAGMGWVRVTETMAVTGCVVTTANYDVTINTGAPAIAPGLTSGDLNVCRNGTLNINVSDVAGASTYVWDYSWIGVAGSEDASTAVSAASISLAGLAPGVYTVSVAGKNGCGRGPWMPVHTFTINDIPDLSPLSNLTCSDVPSGITLAITNSGAYCSGITYNITAINYGGLTASAGSPAIGTGFAANEIANDAYTNKTGANVNVVYTVVPVSTQGCPGPSEDITLTVRPEPVLAALSTTKCSDEALGFNLSTAAGSVAAATYNITAINMNGLTASAGAPAVANGLAAAVISNDAYTNTTAAPVNVVYTIVPVSASGCSGDSYTMTITVNPEPVLATLNTTKCSDEPLGFNLNTAVGSVAASTYNITAINMNGLTASAGAPAVANGLAANVISNDAYTNTTNAPVNVVYTVVPVSASGCAGNSSTITIIVNPEPVLAALGNTVCSDSPSSITLSVAAGSVAASTYNITAINMNGLTASAGSPAVANGLAANVISDDAYTNKTAANVNVVYTVVPVSAAGCQGNPVSVTLIVRPEPVLAALSTNKCSDEPLGFNLNTAVGSVAAANYNITAINMNGLTASAGAPAVANGLAAAVIADDAYTNTTAAPVNVVYTIVPVSALGCLGDSYTMTIIINPEPTLATLNTTKCSDEPLGFNLNTAAGSVAASTYNITAINMNGLTASAGAPVVANGLAANVISNDAYTNTTNAPVNVVYTVVPVSASGCSGNSSTITIIVNPEPVLATLNTTRCSDEALGFNLNTAVGSVAASTYNITAINMNGLTASAGVPAVANGLAANVISDDAYTNTTNAPVNVVYTVVPVSASGCAGNSSTVTITVNPEPVLAAISNTVCSNSPSSTNLSVAAGSVAAATYNITAINMNGLAASAGAPVVANGLAANVIFDDAYTNTSGANVNVVYTVVPVSASGCQGTPGTVTITIKPQPVGSNAVASVCSGNALNYDLQGNLNGNNAVPSRFTYTVVSGDPANVPAEAARVVPSSSNITHIYTNTTGVLVAVTYTITPVSNPGACTGASFTYTVTVGSEPVLNAGLNKFACSNEAINLLLAPAPLSVMPSHYNIISKTLSGSLTDVGNAAIPFATAAADYLLNDKFINTSAVNQTVTYRVQPVLAPDCFGDPVDVVITIRPPIVPGVLAGNTDICYDTDAPVISSLVPASGGDGVITYSWYFSELLAAVPGDASWSPIAGETGPTYNPGILTNPTKYIRYATDGSCVAEVYSNMITIGINPLPVTSEIDGDLFMCSNATNRVYQVDLTGASTFAWTIPGIFDPVFVGNLNFIIVSAEGTTGTGIVQVVETITATGCVGLPKTLNVTVSPIFPSLVPDGPVSVCQGETGIVYSVPENAGSVYSWIVPAGASITSDPTLHEIEVTFTLPGSGPVSVVEHTPSGCTTVHLTKIVTINPLPLKYNVTSPIAYCSGDPGVTVSLSNSETGVNYQLFNSGGAVDAPVPGTTGSALTWLNKPAETYYVVATNATTACTQQMNGTATPVVNMIAGGTIGTDQTICESTAPAPLSSLVAGTGTGSITYQWQNSIDGIAFNDIPGATSVIYGPGSLTQDRWYQRIAISTLGGNACSDFSNIVYVKVDNFSPGVITADQTICENTAPTEFTSSTAPSGDGGAFTYQWQSSTDGISYSDVLVGGTSEDYTSGNLTQDTWFKRFVTSTLDGNICTEETNSVRVTVVNFTPGVIGTDQTICEGTAPALFTGTAASGDGTFTYQWQDSPDGTTFTDIVGATAATYASTPLSNNTWFRREATSVLNASCVQHSNIVAVTINSFDPGSISAPETICEGTAPAAFTSVAPTGVVGAVFTYIWQSSTDGATWVNIPGATNELYASPALIQDTHFRRQVTSTLNGNQCTELTAPILVTVNNLTPGTISGAQTVCEGEVPTAALTSASTFTDGITGLEWHFSIDNETTWAPVAGATAASFSPLALTQDTWYKLVVSSVLGVSTCIEETNVIKITVNNFDPGSIGTDQTICEGTPAAPITSVTPTGDGVFTYKWYSSTDDGSSWNLIAGASETYSPGLLANDTWYYREVTSTLSTVACALSTNIVRITVNNLTPGVIGADQTICEGAIPAEFTVVTPHTGDGVITYQWQESSNGIVFTDIAGAEAATYTSASLSTDTWFRRYVTSTLGTEPCALSSNIIKVTVVNFVPGSIGSDQTICEATAPIAFTSVAASGDGAFTYQWQNSTDGTTFANIPGATSATYSAPALTVDTWYQRIVTSTLSTVPCALSTNIIKVTVNNFDPGSIAAAQTICEGTAPVAFTSVAPTGDGTFTYQWQNSLDGVSFSNITGATLETYTSGALTLDTWFRRIVTSTLSSVPCALSTNIIKVTVNNFDPGSIAASQTICDGETPVAFTSVDATGDGTITYQWESSLDGIAFAPIATATNPAYAPGGLTADTWYKRVATAIDGAATCVKETDVVKITVINFLPGSIGANHTICEGSAAAAITSVTPTGDGAFTYRWFSSPDNSTWTVIPMAISETYNPGAIPADTYYKREVTSTLFGKACVAETNVILITVNNFLPGTISGEQTVCEGVATAAVTTLVAPSGDGIFTYQWKSSLDGINFTNIAGATLDTYSAGILAQDTWFKLSVTSTLNTIPCVKETNFVKVTVNNVTGGTVISDQTICKGNDPVVFTSIVNGTGDGVVTFQWQQSADGVLFADIPGETAPNYDAPALLADTWYKRITKSDLGGVECTKESNILLITVNEVTGGMISADQTICYGQSPLAFASVDDGTGLGAITYQWQRSSDNVIFNNIGGANTFTYAAGVHFADTYYKRVLISIHNGIVCTAESNVIKITINPLPVAILTGGETICPLATSIINVNIPVGTGPFELNIENHGVVAGYVSGANITVSPVVTTTYRLLSVRDANGCEVLAPSGSLSGTAIVVVSTIQGIGSFTPSPAVCEFTPAVFNVTATGTNPTYQWYVDDGTGAVPVADGGVYAGSTTNRLQIFSATRDMNGYIYYVVVSGCGPDVPSANAVFTVNTAPELTLHPTDQVVCTGSTITMEADALPPVGLTWIWYVNKGAGFIPVTPDVNFSGETTKTLTITDVQASFNNWLFRAGARGVCGVETFTNFGRLTVKISPAVTIQPLAKIICENGNTNFISNGTGYIGLQWQKSTDGGATWADFTDDAAHSGTATNQLSIVSGPVTLNGNQYRLGLVGECTTVYSNAVLLTVNASPVVDFSAVDPISACGGVPVVINGNPTGGSGVWTQHRWTGDVGPLNSYTIQSPTFSSNISGSYTLTYRATDNKGCYAEGTVTVNVDSPSADFTQDITAGCTPLDVQFNKDMTGLASFTWDFNDGTPVNTTDANPQHQFVNSNPSTIGYYNVKLTVQSPGGCEDTYTSMITVYPAIDATFTASNDTVCSGSTLVFNTLPGASKYFWEYGDGTSGYSTNVASHLYTNFGIAPVVQTVRLTTTSFYDCVDIKEYNIVVMPVPLPQFTADPATQVYNASGNPVNFTNTTNPGSWTWSWNFGDGGTSTEESPVHTYTELGEFTVTLSVSNASCADEIEHIVRILPKAPIADFDSIPSGCEPWAIQINNTSLNTEMPGTTYRWDFGDGGTSTAKNPTYTYFDPGTYRVELTVTGPGGTSIKSRVVHSYPSPRAYFELSPDFVFVNDQKVRFFNLSEGSDSWLWEFGDGDTSKVKDPFHKYMEEGVFDITLWAYSNNGCSDKYILAPGVTVEPAGEVRFSTVFTPNKDGAIERTDLPTGGIELDQFFFPPIREKVINYKLQVFNRLGVLIFESRDINIPWNGYYKGKLCSQGVYVWYVEGKYANGVPFKKVGDVTLLH